MFSRNAYLISGTIGALGVYYIERVKRPEVLERQRRLAFLEQQAAQKIYNTPKDK